MGIRSLPHLPRRTPAAPGRQKRQCCSVPRPGRGAAGGLEAARTPTELAELRRGTQYRCEQADAPRRPVCCDWAIAWPAALCHQPGRRGGGPGQRTTSWSSAPPRTAMVADESYYKALGVDINAGCDAAKRLPRRPCGSGRRGSLQRSRYRVPEIRRRYKELAIKWHPDKLGRETEEFRLIARGESGSVRGSRRGELTGMSHRCFPLRQLIPRSRSRPSA